MVHDETGEEASGLKEEEKAKRFRSLLEGFLFAELCCFSIAALILLVDFMVIPNYFLLVGGLAFSPSAWGAAWLGFFLGLLWCVAQFAYAAVKIAIVFLQLRPRFPTEPPALG